MKTLVLFGSPRPNGHTKQMLDVLLENLDKDNKEHSENKIIDAYKYYHSDSPIAPCVDCRYCWKNNRCSIDDSMSDVYSYLEQCDNIVIATPIYFYGIPAPLKIIIDRCQVYWASMVRGDKPKHYNKKATILMSGGAKPFESQFDCANTILKRVLDDINAKLIDTITFPNTDNDCLKDNMNIYNKIIQTSKKIKL